MYASEVGRPFKRAFNKFRDQAPRYKLASSPAGWLENWTGRRTVSEAGVGARASRKYESGWNGSNRRAPLIFYAPSINLGNVTRGLGLI